MRVNIRKGDIVQDTLDDTDKWVGLVVDVKGQVAEVYYPQYSGRVWLPFDTLVRLDGNEQTFSKIVFQGAL